MRGRGAGMRGHDPALPCPPPPGGPGWGSPREMSGSWRPLTLGKEEEKAESTTPEGLSRCPPCPRPRPAGPAPPHAPAPPELTPAPQLPPYLPSNASGSVGSSPGSESMDRRAAPAAPAAFVRGFGGFPGIQTPAIASAIFASGGLKPLKPARSARRAGTGETEREPPCLMRAARRAGRAAPCWLRAAPCWLRAERGGGSRATGRERPGAISSEGRSPEREGTGRMR